MYISSWQHLHVVDTAAAAAAAAAAAPAAAAAAAMIGVSVLPLVLYIPISRKTGIAQDGIVFYASRNCDQLLHDSP